MTDTTLRQWRKLIDMGYSPTSFTHPSRIVNERFEHIGNRRSLLTLQDHPAAIFCCPHTDNGSATEDNEKRQVVKLVVTAYLQSDAKQLKAVMAVLDEFNLTSGPFFTDAFGNRSFILQYHGEDRIFKIGARLCFPADDNTVFFSQVERSTGYRTVKAGELPSQFLQRESDASHLIPLGGVEWSNGSPLTVSHRKLPELILDSAHEIIAQVEEVRWFGRPATLLKDKAA